MSLLVIRKNPRLFVNILTVDDRYYLLNRHNLTERVMMQLSKKQKAFSEISFGFLNALLNIEHLPTKDDPHSSCISGNTGSEKCG